MKLVSIIVPMKNAEAFVAGTLDSLLAQTYLSIEIIIVNDGSTDKSLKIIESLKNQRIKIIDGEGKGISSTLNLALNFANGEYVCRCDADDVSLPDRFEMQIKYLEEHADIVCVSGNYEYMDEAGRKLTTIYMPLNDDDIQSSCLNGAPALCHGCSMMRRWALDDAGGYIVGMEPAEDLDLWLRLG